MSINPLLQLSLILILSVIYGIGNYGRSEHSEILKAIGIGGIGLLILNIFFTTCAGAAIGTIIQIAGTVIITQLLVWLYFKITEKEKNGRLNLKNPKNR